METFEVDSCGQGHHIYKSVWNWSAGEELGCNQESTNTEDLYTVAVVRRSTIVGHVTTASCSLFLKQKGTIHCRVTASCHFSGDLPQGSLEVPCMLIFHWQFWCHVLCTRELVITSSKYCIFKCCWVLNLEIFHKFAKLKTSQKLPAIRYTQGYDQAPIILKTSCS